jgi:uncharacterized protein (DUF2267 family)
MQYDEFVGQVQHRARLDSKAEARCAIEATLETLGECLLPGEAGHLAIQLPPEIGTHLREAETTNASFNLRIFFERVANRESVDFSEAIHHSRAVIAVLKKAVTPAKMAEVQEQLSDEFVLLFQSGSAR